MIFVVLRQTEEISQFIGLEKFFSKQQIAGHVRLATKFYLVRNLKDER